VKTIRKSAWLIASLTGLLLAYTAYQTTLHEAAETCTDSLSAAAIADPGQDQGLLVDHALLRSPECNQETDDQSGQ
jgi:hypothetical protein